MNTFEFEIHRRLDLDNLLRRLPCGELCGMQQRPIPGTSHGSAFCVTLHLNSMGVRALRFMLKSDDAHAVADSVRKIGSLDPPPEPLPCPSAAP